MYCKLKILNLDISKAMVLIVAKCIVNLDGVNGNQYNLIVLIVAKCIVNRECWRLQSFPDWVLIVAKCIVNISKG